MSGSGAGSEQDFLGDLIVLVVVIPVALGVATVAAARASRKVLAVLVSHHVLVADPLVAVPGTGVGLDAARLVIIAGVLIGLGAAWTSHRRRRGAVR